MRLLPLLLLFCFAATAQTSNSFTFTPLSGTYTRGPFAGPEKWQGTTNDTVSGTQNPAGFYRRLAISEITTADSNVYDWAKVRTAALQAVNQNQYLSLGLMAITPFAEETGFNTTFFYDGGHSSYPVYVHNLMQGEARPDYIGVAGHWIPNYNSPHFIRWVGKWHVDFNNFLDTATVQATAGPKAGQTIAIENIIGCLDVRVIGSYGEWHHYSSAPGNNIFNLPAGIFPTIASFKAIIDAQVNALQKWRLVVMIAGFDGERLQNTWIPEEIGWYLLSRRTSWGLLGWRRDQWGANDQYLDAYLKDNDNVYNGNRFDTAIMNRYKYAPITGEPPGGGDFNFGGINLGALAIQVRTYHAAWIGNGNYGGGFSVGGAWQDTARLAFRLAGWHYQLKSGSVVIGSNFTVNLRWQNTGLAPSYDHWQVQYSLRNGAGATVWTGNSAFDPYLFLPEYGEVTRTDAYTMPAVAPGNYSLWVTVKDPENYLPPMALQITGRDASGSYFLSNIVIPTGTAGRPNTSAGVNQSITLPDTDAALSGSASGGTAPLTYQWTQTGGPVTATIVSPTLLNTDVTGLNTVGTYTFDLTVTDANSETASDNMTVTVNETPNIAPIADAGASQNATLPVDSILLDGSNSSDDTGITAYFWELVSGPAGVIISTPTNDSTYVKNLTNGTYVFRLSVSDGALQDTDETTLTINGPAVLNRRSAFKYRFKNH